MKVWVRDEHSETSPMELSEVIYHHLVAPAGTTGDTLDIRNIAKAVGRLIDRLCEKGYLAPEEAIDLLGGTEALGHTVVVHMPDAKPEPPLQDTLLDLPLDDPDLGLRFPVRVDNALRSGRIFTLRDLIGLRRHELLRMRNFGYMSLAVVSVRLNGIGLDIGMSAKEIAQLDTPVDDLELSVRANSILTTIKCRHVSDLVGLTKEDVAKASGRKNSKVVFEITEALKRFGFHLRTYEAP